MNEMIKIKHQDYGKITDVCMWLSNNYILKFNVELIKHKSKDNYHKEIGYNINGCYRVNINRDFDYYLSIESVKRSDEGNKLQLRIGINEIYFFRYNLHGVSSWFTNKSYESLFIKKDGKIIMPIKVDPIRINIMFNNYIEFEPSICNLDNGDQIIGVRVYLNSDGVSFFMSANNLISFTYFIDTFNMYQSAQLMLNYLGRPENGTNYFGYEQQSSNQGFFSRINAKREN